MDGGTYDEYLCRATFRAVARNKIFHFLLEVRAFFVVWQILALGAYRLIHLLETVTRPPFDFLGAHDGGSLVW